MELLGSSESHCASSAQKLSELPVPAVDPYLHLTLSFTFQAPDDVVLAVLLAFAGSEVVLALGIFAPNRDASSAFMRSNTGVHLLTLTVDDFSDLLLGVCVESIPRERLVEGDSGSGR